MPHEAGRFQFNVAMTIPLLGWLYIAVGLIWPFQHWLLVAIWWIDLFLSVVVHGIQIFIARPIGARQGFSTTQTVFYTLVFGATWWKVLQQKPPSVSES